MMSAKEALEMARAGGCVPFELLSCIASGITHDCCASLLLDGFTVAEITRAERAARTTEPRP